jgi:hypothetical protein
MPRRSARIGAGSRPASASSRAVATGAAGDAVGRQALAQVLGGDMRAGLAAREQPAVLFAIFPFSDPAGYRAANDRVLAAAEAADGQLVAFCRVNPGADGVAEARRALRRGAAGIKYQVAPARGALLAARPQR